MSTATREHRAGPPRQRFSPRAPERQGVGAPAPPPAQPRPPSCYLPRPSTSRLANTPWAVITAAGTLFSGSPGCAFGADDDGKLENQRMVPGRWSCFHRHPGTRPRDERSDGGARNGRRAAGADPGSRPDDRPDLVQAGSAGGEPPRRERLGYRIVVDPTPRTSTTARADREALPFEENSASSLASTRKRWMPPRSRAASSSLS